MLDDDAAAVAEKVAAARAAQPAWAARPLAERIEIMRGFRARSSTESDDARRTLTSEIGKPITPVAATS